MNPPPRPPEPAGSYGGAEVMLVTAMTWHLLVAALLMALAARTTVRDSASCTFICDPMDSVFFVLIMAGPVLGLSFLITTVMILRDVRLRRSQPRSEPPRRTATPSRLRLAGRAMVYSGCGMAGVVAVIFIHKWMY